MGHPDLDIDVTQYPPLLESQQISSLHNQYVPSMLLVSRMVLFCQEIGDIFNCSKILIL